MKKLLIDVNSVVPYYVSGKVTGIGRTTLELIHALAQLDSLPFEISLYSQNMKGIGGKNTDLPFKCRHLYIPYRETYDKLLSRTPIKEWYTGYDIMHIPHNFEYVRNPSKCIATLHDALFMHIQEKAFAHDQMRKHVPILMQQCKSIITCSKYSKNDIIETMQIVPDKIHVIYWGVKHDVFYPTNLSNEEIEQELHSLFKLERNYFLSVSCNAERKRTHILIDCYIKLCKQLPINDLVLVWANPPQVVVEKINNSIAKKKIHILSSVTDENLALLYNGATALFFPSSYEGFGLPILEAMACGTPVVTCKNSSLTEVGEDSVIYLDEPIQDSLIEIMELIENSNRFLIPYKKAGIHQAAKFTWKETAGQTIEVYKRALNIT